MADLQFSINLYKDDDSGLYVAECINLPGCMSQGSTESEALANIKSAIIETLEVIKDEHSLGGKGSSLREVNIPLKAAFA